MMRSQIDSLSQVRDWLASDTEPTSTFPGLLWLDTSADPHVLKRRNGTDDGWVTVGAAGGGGSVAVDDDGTEVVAEASRLNFGTGLSVTDDTGGAVTIDAESGAHAETVGDDTETTFAVSHNLGTLDVQVQLWDLTGTDPVLATGDATSIEATDADTVTVTFGSAPATDAYRIVVLASGGTGGAGGAAGESLGGTVTIEDPDTDAEVTHGLPRTPFEWEIGLRPLDAEAAAADWWLSNHASSTFKVNLAAAPTTSAKFGWLWTPADEAVPPTYTEAVLTDNPIGYWRLEETSGTNAADEIAANDGTLIGGTSLDVTGKVGSAASFDGSDGRLETFPIGDHTEFSVELWIKTAGSSDDFDCVTSIIDQGSGNAFQLRLFTDGRLRLENRTASSGSLTELTSNGTVNDNEWHHVVVRLSQGSFQDIWIDGQLDNSGGASSGSWDLSTTELPFACRYTSSSDRFLDCELDEIAVYDKALSGTRIADHYNAA